MSFDYAICVYLSLPNTHHQTWPPPCATKTSLSTSRGVGVAKVHITAFREAAATKRRLLYGKAPIHHPWLRYMDAASVMEATSYLFRAWQTNGERSPYVGLSACGPSRSHPKALREFPALRGVASAPQVPRLCLARGLGGSDGGRVWSSVALVPLETLLHSSFPWRFNASNASHTSANGQTRNTSVEPAG